MNKRTLISQKLKLEVYEKYRGKCAKCSSTKILHTHHVDGDKSNTVLENLILLCKKCHLSEHGGYQGMEKMGAMVVAKIRQELVDELAKFDKIFAEFIRNRKRTKSVYLVITPGLKKLLQELNNNHHE